jgi:hypothetical protein
LMLSCHYRPATTVPRRGRRSATSRRSCPGISARRRRA